MTDTPNPSDFVGSTPPREARPVSLAVRNYVDQHFEGTQNRGLIVAVSGGADSLALVVAAADVARRRGIPLQAAIVNHRLRDDSAVEAAGARSLLEGMGIAAVVLQDAEPADLQNARPLEGTARATRHRLLEHHARIWAEDHGISSVDILYGHTLDDQAETVLLRLGRGASPRALSAMSMRTEVLSPRGPALYRGRPLLDVRRADTEAFCSALGLTWVEDPTNTEEGAWTNSKGHILPRNAIRHRVLPALSQALGQDAAPALARVAELLNRDEWALDQQAERVVAELGGSSRDDSQAEVRQLQVEQLLTHPAAIRSRVYLKVWESLLGVPLSQAQIEAVDQLVTNSHSGPHSPVGKQIQLPGGGLACRHREYVEFQAPQPAR